VNKIKKNIFIACDTSKIAELNNIIKNTKTNKVNIFYKIGLEFFNSRQGRAFISSLKKELIFLDLKLNDIPQTVFSTILSLKDLKNIRYITVHANGGLEMLKAAKRATKKINKKIKILGVTVLTSFSEKSLKQTGHTKKIKNIVLLQTKLAKKAGLDGIICSGHEAKLIKNTYKKMDIITPGIRLPGDARQDQKRVLTPKKAFLNGATGIVIGRSITKGDIKNNIQKLIESLN
jgi:orotidine-5'-phosphate decarboxylase